MRIKHFLSGCGMATALLAPLGEMNAERIWTGYALAPRETEARSQALHDLAGSLRSDVRSTYLEEVTNDLQNVSMVYSISVDLPILDPSIQVTTPDDPRNVKVIASLFQQRSLPLYLAELQRIQTEAAAMLEALATAETISQRELQLRSLLAAIDEYARYRVVALVLGAELAEVPQLPISKAAVQGQLHELADVADDIRRAAHLLTAGIEQRSIYIHAAQAQGSTIPTRFARLLREQMGTRLNVVSSPANADFVMHGYYDFNDSWLDIIYHLREPGQNRTLTSRAARMPITALAGIEYLPAANDMEMLMRKDFMVANELRVELSTCMGQENLAFVEGDIIELFVKANRECSFYLVNYIQRRNEAPYAHIIPLTETRSDDERYSFVMQITAENVNRRVSLGRFRVEAPYGIESVQVVAMRNRTPREVLNWLPARNFNPSNGMHEISEDGVRASMNQALMQTRALRRLPDPPEVSEHSIFYVTYPQD